MRVDSSLRTTTGPLARITDLQGKVCGAGLLVGDRHVLTCAHVVDSALGRTAGTHDRPDDPVFLDLPFLDQSNLQAEVVAWYPMGDIAEGLREQVSDVAVLALDRAVAGGFDPRRSILAASPEGTPFRAFGFPRGIDTGTPAEGELTMVDAGGWQQVRDTQNLGYFIEPGFSGGPVFERRGEGLLGMSAAADMDGSRRLAFVIPTQVLCQAWPPLARPYKGLARFEPSDTDLFFGREAEIAELAAKIERRSFVTVLGPSGSGKSSMVRAGLVPKLLKDGGWAVAVCRPGNNPLYELAKALSDEGTGRPGFGIDRRATQLAAEFAEEPQRLLDYVSTVLDAFPNAHRLLLVIDQFEELFTLDPWWDTPDGHDVPASDAEPVPSLDKRRAAFVDLVALAGRQREPSPLHIVATMRADFTGRALENAALADLLRDGDVKLGPMSAEGLMAAITRPADAFGVSFEADLPERMQRAMEDAPGALPLLQFALDRLWDGQSNRVITHTQYDAIGGIGGALSDHAEAFFDRLDEQEKLAARRVLTRLVRLAKPGDQAEDTRAVMPRYEIGEDDWPLVVKLADARLVTTNKDPLTDQETAELIHEALIAFSERQWSQGDGGVGAERLRAWDRLKTWLDEDREFGLWRQRLAGYVENHRERNSVLPADLVAEALVWREAYKSALNDDEIALIDDSREARDREEREKRAREQERLDLLESTNSALEQAAAEREDRARQRLVFVTLGFTLAAVTLVAISYFFVRERASNQSLVDTQVELTGALERADKAAGEAQRAAVEARGRQLAADAQITQFEISGLAATERAAALSLEAWRRFETSGAFQAASRALVELPVWRHENETGARFLTLLEPVTEFFVVKAGSVLQVRDTTTGDLRHEIALAGDLGQSTLNLASGRVVNWDNEHGGVLADLTTGKIVAEFGPARSARFSSDGARLAVAEIGEPARVFDTATGAVLREVFHGIEPPVVIIEEIEPDPDAPQDGVEPVIIVETPPSGPEPAPVFGVTDVSMDASGRLLASGGGDGLLNITDIDTGETLHRMQMSTAVRRMTISPDGSYFGATDWDGGAYVVAVPDQDVRVATFMYSGLGNDYTFRGTDVIIRTGWGDIEIYDLATGTQRLLLNGTARPDGTLFGLESDTVLASNGSQTVMADYSGSEPVIYRGTVDHLGNHIVGGPNGRFRLFLNGGNVRLVDLRGYSPGPANWGEVVFRRDGSEEVRMTGAAFSPDGRTVAIGDSEGQVLLLNVDDASEAAVLPHERPRRFQLGFRDVSGFAFNEAGTLLITENDQAIRAFRLPAGPEMLRLDDPFHPDYGGVTTVDTAILPGGDQIAVLRSNGLSVVSASDGSVLWEVPGLDNARTLRASPDGTRLAIGSDQQIRVFDAATGAVVAPGPTGYGFGSLEYSRDGSQLVAHTVFGFVSVVDANTGVSGESFGVDESSGIAAISHLAVFSADGKRIYASTSNGVGIFDANDGALVHHVGGIEGFDGGVSGIAAPDVGNEFLALFSNGVAAIVSAESGAVRVLTEQATARPDLVSDVSRALDISDDGRLAAVGVGTSVQVFDTATAQLVSASEYANEATDMEFISGGSRLLTTNADGTARVVDASTGAEILRFDHDAGVQSFALSDDGNRLATVDRVGSVRVFDLNENRVFELLCDERTGRNLSTAEWLRHFGTVDGREDTCDNWRSGGGEIFITTE